MNVRVQIDLSVPPVEKHIDALRSAAQYLTDDEQSVQITFPADKPESLIAGFTITKARQMDVVDKIMRECAMCMEDYQDQTVWFPKVSGKKSPRKKSK